MEPVGTTLIVDDNADDRFFMNRALRRVAPDMIAHYALSGADAVAYLKGHRPYADRTDFPYPDFVVTDLQMSNGDGFSVLSAVQQQAQSRLVPIMMLSTSADPDHIRRAYALGASSYCLKPQGGDGLCAIITAFLKGHLPDKAQHEGAGERLRCA